MNTKFTSAYLFYDAMSGDFIPPTDPQNGRHTLGRLLMATFQKGDRKNTPQDTFSYRPSWAPGSIAIAEALRSGEVTGLTIHQDIPAGGSNWASFSKLNRNGIGSGPHIGMSDSTGLRTAVPLELGSGLFQLQETVAEVAQGFYDRLKVAIDKLPESFRTNMLDIGFHPEV